MKKIASLFLTITLTTALFGCAQRDTSTTETSQIETEQTSVALAETAESVSETEISTEEVITDDTFLITDMAGRQVKIKKDIEKIATFGSVGVLNAFVELMGDGDKIAHDMPERFATGENWKMQYEFAPQMAGLPVLEENEILIEKVLEVSPDVCFVMNKESAEFLEENGQTVVYIEWKQDEDVKDAVRLVGEVLGKQDVAEQYIQYFDETVEKANLLTKNITDEQKKKVLYTNYTNMSQPHQIAEWWIDKSGGKSVTSGEGDYTLEDLLVWNPDVIFVSAKEQVEEIKQENRLKEITAVKNNQIFVAPSVAHIWGNRTVEQPLTVMWALHKTYPELLSYEELSKEIFNFYSTFYGYNLSEEQIKDIIG